MSKVAAPSAPRKANRPSAKVIELFHTTPRRNLSSIFRCGLRPDRARGKLKAVWLTSAARRDWALAHVSKRHDTPASELVVLVIRVRRADLRRRSSGVWFCPAVVSPLKIFGVNALRAFAG